MVKTIKVPPEEGPREGTSDNNSDVSCWYATTISGPWNHSTPFVVTYTLTFKFVISRPFVNVFTSTCGLVQRSRDVLKNVAYT